ncbi:hypothetical protein Lal_00024268 [Lupinus albus]|nr:hypothetical protein Lal_00024268 [Lupinus albus]
MQWLEMDDLFMPTVIGELQDETVRMKTALKLVMHDMNKMKKEVKTKKYDYNYQQYLDNLRYCGQFLDIYHIDYLGWTLSSSPILAL